MRAVLEREIGGVLYVRLIVDRAKAGQHRGYGFVSSADANYLAIALGESGAIVGPRQADPDLAGAREPRKTLPRIQGKVLSRKSRRSASSSQKRPKAECSIAAWPREWRQLKSVRVWPENWICMKMRWFGTVAPRAIMGFE